MSLLANSNAIESGGYNIDRSLRFRSSASAYLNRTPASASNRKTWTWSGWVKRGTLGTSNRIFAADDGSASTDQDYNTLFFTSSNKIQFSGGLTNFRITTSVYRDPSAWYHIVFVTDTTQATAGNRFKLYVNGTEVTAFDTSNNPAQNTDLAVNAAIGHYHAAIASPVVNYFDGYLAEVNFIDGQALTPSSFGETSTETGVWVPKKYTGTYGTNGFYLNFSDNTSATTLAYDKSGNGNNWTANNISTTAGATYDSMTDVPTLTSATAANYCVLNPLDSFITGGVTISNGNLTADLNRSTYNGWSRSTIALPTSGLWYFEYVQTAVNTGTTNTTGVGVISTDTLRSVEFGASGSWLRAMYLGNGNKYTSSGGVPSSSVYGSSSSTNTVIGVAVNMNTGLIWFRNASGWYNSGDPTNSSDANAAYSDLVSSGKTWLPFFFIANEITSTSSINFGQRPFSYTPPTGFKALNTFNLPDPTIKKPNQYMDATLYTGNASSRSITNASSFQPDFVWIKSRSNAVNNSLFDSVRGVYKCLVTNNTTAEDGTGTDSLTAFNSNGFSLGANTLGASPNVNVNTYTYVGWQWKKGATAGFDIVTYTGNGANRTIAHNLGVAPKMIIVKNRSGVYDWRVYVESIGAGNILLLNTTAASTASSTSWNSTAPTSSVFSIGTAAGVNNNGDNFVAYLFAEIAGFSKFGSYTGNGSADGPFVYCGFRPKFVLIKSTSGVTDWNLFDSTRGPDNPNTPLLRPNSSGAEATASSTSYAMPDFLSNGFKLRTTSGEGNASGGTYIFMAFAESPFKTSLAR